MQDEAGYELQSLRLQTTESEGTGWRVQSYRLQSSELQVTGFEVQVTGYAGSFCPCYEGKLKRGKEHKKRKEHIRGGKTINNNDINRTQQCKKTEHI